MAEKARTGRGRRAELPLFVWGERRLCALARRRRLRLAGAGIAFGTAALALTIIAPPTPRLVWNASASVPIGLYRIVPGAAIARGNMVLVWLPDHARALAARRGYLPANVPAVKRVAASVGARVCAREDTIWIDGRQAATRLAADRLGRSLPWWHGCRTLSSGEVFLLVCESPASFDGRYFGVVSTRQIVGRAVLLWAPTGSETRHD